MWLAEATLRCDVTASHCGGFSCCRARALGEQVSVVVARGLSSCGLRALECRLSSCGAWALLLRGMWDLPGPGLKPMSPALAGGFLTTAPPGKSPSCCLSLIFPILIIVCLGVDLLGFILFGTLCHSRFWMSVSFPKLQSFSGIISLNKFPAPFFLSSPSGTPTMQKIACLMLFQRSLKLSSFF